MLLPGHDLLCVTDFMHCDGQGAWGGCFGATQLIELVAAPASHRPIFETGATVISAKG